MTFSIQILLTYYLLILLLVSISFQKVFKVSNKIFLQMTIKKVYF